MSKHAIQSLQLNPASSPNFWHTVGLPSKGIALHQALRKGVPYSVFGKLTVATGLENKQLARYLSIPPATLNRRATAGRFKTDESDRLFRLADMYKSAIDLFEGDQGQAMLWLTHPIKGLGDRAPLEMLGTSVEVNAVRDLIGRLEHGVVV